MHKLRKIFAFFIAFIMTIALLPGGSVVHAAESNSELKLVASREGDTITVNVKSVKDMIFGGMEITLGFDSDQFELEAYSDGKLYETQFDTTAYNPNLRFFSLAAGTPFTATPDGQPIISIKYKVKDGFKADTDYTFTYTFDDCFTNKREDYESIGAVLDVTYRENTVSFDLNEGEAGTNDYSDQLVVTGEKATNPGNPTRSGYVFKGWKAAETDTEYFNFSTPITKKTTLTADWAKEYEVSYKVTGDAPEGYEAPKAAKKLKDDEVNVAAAPESPVSGKKDGINGTYTFTGWTAPEEVTVEDGTFTMPAQDVEFTGSWTFTPAKHTVKFVDDDGSEISSTEYDEGTKAADIDKPEDPTKAADSEYTYTFAGWTPDIADVTADATYTATYTATPIPVEQVTVTFDFAGGTKVDAQTFDKGGSATEPAAPTKDGFDFVGWKLDGEDYDFSSAVNDDITLTASWTKKDEPDEPQPQDDGNYTVDTNTAGHTYQIFQIFTGDISTLGEGTDAKEVLTNVVWGQNGTGTKGADVDQTILDALTAVVGQTLDKTKLAVIENYVNTSGTPIAVITVDDNEKKSVDLPAGYYLIRDVPDSQDGKDDAYTTYITRVVNNYTVKPKSAKPTVKKEVADNDDRTATGNGGDNNGFGSTADHAIGESFQFRLTASLTKDEDYAAYPTYKVQFTDTMSDGITFEKIDSVTVGCTAINNYTCTADADQAGGSWTLTIDDIKSITGVDLTAKDCDVVVTYSAHLNESADARSDGGTIADTNKNGVKLTYSNNPNTGGSGDNGETTTGDNVWVFTYKVDNTKMGETDGNKAPLPDAGFRLYKADGTTEIPLVYHETKGAYVPAAAGATGVEMKSASGTGAFNIAGLDAGTYVLKETTTPAGYNKCDDTTITIKATHKEDADGTKATLDLTGSTMKNEIINKAGRELPSTGGIGTTIFYVIGGILVIGAGVVLITRRRMSGN